MQKISEGGPELQTGFAVIAGAIVRGAHGPTLGPNSALLLATIKVGAKKFFAIAKIFGLALVKVHLIPHGCKDAEGQSIFSLADFLAQQSLDLWGGLGGG
jgi:hypothetical protein